MIRAQGYITSSFGVLCHPQSRLRVGMKYPRQTPRTCLFAIVLYDFIPFLRVFLTPYSDLFTNASDTDLTLILPRVTLRFPSEITFRTPFDNLYVFVKLKYHKILKCFPSPFGVCVLCILKLIFFNGHRLRRGSNFFISKEIAELWFYGPQPWGFTARWYVR